jgi:uncharacterized Zn-finger protein
VAIKRDRNETLPHIDSLKLLRYRGCSHHLTIFCALIVFVCKVTVTSQKIVGTLASKDDPKPGDRCRASLRRRSVLKRPQNHVNLAAANSNRLRKFNGNSAQRRMQVMSKGRLLLKLNATSGERSTAAFCNTSDSPVDSADRNSSDELPAVELTAANQLASNAIRVIHQLPSCRKKLRASKPKTHRCPVCSKEFPSSKLVRQHISELHLSAIQNAMRRFDPASVRQRTVTPLLVANRSLQERYDCSVCGLSLTTAGSLKRHKIDIHGEDRRQYTCEVCGMSVSSASSLSRHKVLVHNPQRKHVCGVCGRAFALKQTLEQHMSGVHLKYRPHLCSLCGDRFLKRDNLRNHMRLVHREKCSQ